MSGRKALVLNVLIGLMIGASAVLVWFVPRSILAFMAFQASLLVIYLIPLSMRAKLGWAVIALQQAQRHIAGGERSLELALTGRIVHELEYEVLQLITRADR